MTEILFYHLQTQPLEEILPGLLKRSLARNWRVVVESGLPERLEDIDSLLWTYRDDSFLPHGLDSEAFAEHQPILLTGGKGNPFGAQIRFLIHDAGLPDDLNYERLVLLFDGQDEFSVQQARDHWKVLKKTDHDLSYWQQNEAGRWEKKG
tara:strand:- start:5318 stop:5767 length:450 start_codon:yes stop_codon:yes gene_type:complete